jgi:hypothetical protein
MLFKWFDAADAKKFGTALAHFFAERMPSAKNFGDKAFELKANKIMKQMSEQIARFKQQQKLNTYKKAQLGNAFRWTLIDLGIQPDYADKLTQWLMLQIGKGLN